MAEFDEQLLAVIDDRVRFKTGRPIRRLTLVERTSDVTCTVNELGDNSTFAWIAGDVLAAAGDQVLAVQAGSDWVVLGSLTARWPEELAYSYINAGETTVSGSFVAAPGVPAVDNRTFVKRSNASAVIAHVTGTCFISGGVPSRVQWAVQMTDRDTGTVYGPLTAADHNFGTTGRQAQTGFAKFWGANQLPAGRFDALMMWARVPGSAGTIATATGEDRWTLDVREIKPQV
jgi:hypothetical protein